MQLKEDLTQEEVSPPHNYWCSGNDHGHNAPSEWSRNGPGTDKEPTKFFRVTGQGIDMVVCEPCLIIARWMANLSKKGIKL